MKNVLNIGEMIDHCPAWLKDAMSHVAKEAGLKTDSMELHRHSHSEKSKVNQLDPSKRQSLKYVSARTQDRDDEIVIPQTINLKEFRKYAHVLVNHNYSLLPIGSDESIEADDFGIRALTNHADTGEGTLANVIWHLVSQGHMKASSIGFVPTSFTKPGARDWDHVANQLQSNWKEFDKAKAEKSISRIITGGVLLEHSFVSVPCNTDAEMVQVVKGMGVDGKIVKQLGLDVVVKKAEEAPAEDCICGECGLERKCPPGIVCTKEGCTGKMKPKSKEKAVELSTKENPHIPGHSFTECVVIMGDKGYDEEASKRICGKLQAESGEKSLISSEVIKSVSPAVTEVSVKSLGNLSADDVRTQLNNTIRPSVSTGSLMSTDKWVQDLFDDYFIYCEGNDTFRQGWAMVDGKPTLIGKPVKVLRKVVFVPEGKVKAVKKEEIEEECEYLKDGLCNNAECKADGKPCPVENDGECPMDKSEKGDVQGHEFRGNQYSGGGGSGRESGEGKKKEDMASIIDRTTAPGKLAVALGGKVERVRVVDENTAYATIAPKVGTSGFRNVSSHDTDRSIGDALTPKLEEAGYKREGNLRWSGNGLNIRASSWTTSLSRGIPAIQFRIQRSSKKEFTPDVADTSEMIESFKAFFKEEKFFVPSEVKVVRPATSIKVLYSPPDIQAIEKGIAKAVESALARRTGKIL